MTQKELAEKAELSRVAVVRLEAGTPARPSTTRRLAKALGVKPAALMDTEPTYATPNS